MKAYYNEFDPKAAAWLRQLIIEGHIADGDVDERSIVDVRPADLDGYAQHHFFAGIGVWSYALRRAGWPDDRPIWSGSCPCQPFSAAGKGGGTGDARHLWPVWFELIRACRPPIVFGEQVASAAVVGKSSKSRERSRIPTQISAGASGKGFDQACPREGAQEGPAIRSKQTCVCGAGDDRCGRLCCDGSAVQSRWRANMGQPVAGSDRAREGVRLLEYPSDLPCAEQCDRGLGRAEDDRACARDPDQAAREIERLVEGLGGASEGENGPVWFDALQSDLERAHYAIGACDTPSAGIGAPHIRQRLWWVAQRLADANGSRQQQHPQRDSEPLAGCEEGARRDDDGGCSGLGRLADADGHDGSQVGKGHDAIDQQRQAIGRRQLEPAGAGADSGAGDGVHSAGSGEIGPAGDMGAVARPSPTNGFWRNADWLHCRDGKWRPARPGSQPLAHGAPARVGRLRGYGNAIVAPVAEAFIRAVIDEMGGIAEAPATA